MPTVRYSLTTAPDWVPRPRLDADGRYLALRRSQPICLHNHPPDRLAYYVRDRPNRPLTGCWRCLECHRLRDTKRYGLRGNGPMQAKMVAEEPPGGWTPKNPFDFTRVRLEREWGKPYEQWTMAEHRAHTRLLYHLLGWGDAAIKEPVIVRDARGVIHRRSA